MQRTDQDFQYWLSSVEVGMGQVCGYIRVSTDKQTVDNQELAILKYCDAHKLHVDNWYKVEMSSRKTTKQRRIDELMDVLEKGDVLIVSDLSRLARSVGQIAVIVDKLLDSGVRVICIKESMDLNGKRDMKAKVMVTMFSLFTSLRSNGILFRNGPRKDWNEHENRGRCLGDPRVALVSRFSTVKRIRFGI